MSQMPPITFDVAIIGGGPGGLMTAMHVNKKVGAEAKITIFEASPRLGGKLMTGTFAKTGAQYEIGVAEIYDYAHLGFDPLDFKRAHAVHRNRVARGRPALHAKAKALQAHGV